MELDLQPLNLPCSTERPFIIAGPCSAETEDQVMNTAKQLAGKGFHVFRAGIWKPRTKPGGFEGNGEKALPWMQMVKQETGMLTATEVATPEHVELALKYGIDILWIGARTTANPFAMQSLADALKGVDLPVFVKNPVNPDLELWIGALQRLNGAGIKRLGAIHRGFTSYEKKLYRNVPMWQIPIELHRRLPNLPVVNDPSHISGRRDLIAPLCQQAMDLGMDGLMVETAPEVAINFGSTIAVIVDFIIVAFAVFMVVVAAAALAVFVMVMLLLMVGFVQFLNPFCRGGNGFEVEHAGVEQEVEVHIAEVARDDVGLGLYGVQYGAYASQFLLRYLIGLVEQDGVAELYLLDDEVGDVVLGYSLACKVQTASELVLQAECIHHGADAVQGGDVRDGACVEGVEVQGLLVCTDGLCYGGRFADAGGLDDNVVEAFGLHQVAELQDEVHLQRAADAPVLQGHQRVVLLVNDSALLYEVGIDVHLADVVYDDGKAYTSFIIKYAVQQGCLATAQITGYE